MRIKPPALFVLVAFFASPIFAQTKPAAPPLPPGTKIEKDLMYGDPSIKAEALDLYLPEKSDGPLPLIIYIHGGGWSGGDKEHFPGRPFLARGFAVASVNYRFVKEAIFPAQILDCKGAVRFLRAHAKQYHLDPDRFGVWGDSAGGHLVALLGTSGDVKEIEGNVGGNLNVSSRVQAVVDWYGPTDMSVFFDQAEQENIFKPHPEKSPIAGLFGGMPSDHLDLVRQGNPISFVTKDDPPFLIMHGTKDTLVPLAQSQILVDSLKQAGVEVQLDVIQGAGHGFDVRKVLPEVETFFDKHLKPEHSK